MNSSEPILSCRISVDYESNPGVVRDAKLDVYPNEILGLAGQSGSGKSTISLAILKLLTETSKVRGHIQFQGREIASFSERRMREIRGRDIGLVPQSPIAALNPALRIVTQLREAWQCHSLYRDRNAGSKRIAELLDRVQLPTDPDFLNRYPRQLSVGQAQRVLIAMALLHGPKLLIADEPTSALDPMTQAEILELFADLNRRQGIAILLISHDLRSLASLCHRVAILHQGEIVECGETRSLFRNPSHPYTRQLVAPSSFSSPLTQFPDSEVILSALA